VTCSGSLFQMRAPATGKAREPMEVSRTARTIRSDQVIGSRGPESVVGRHISNTDKLPQILFTVTTYGVTK